MKNTAAYALVLVSLLAACAPKPFTVAGAHDACLASYPSRPGNMVAQANCQTSAENSTARPPMDSDLVAQLQAGRLALAKNADSGTITLTAYQQSLHKLEAQAATTQQARNTNTN